MNINELNDIDDIIAFLKECDDEYFNSDDTKISDKEYDLLKRKAFLIEPSNDYFVKIGSDIRGGKIKLPYPMGSLNQLFDGEVKSWATKINSDKFVVTEKLDGASVMLVYNNNKLSIAYSRGNGIEGADITRHLSKIPNVPKTVDDEYLVVRAEAIIKNSVFDKKYSSEYKNPRNLVSGILNRKENPQDILDDVDIVAYEIIASNSFAPQSKTDQLKYLQKQGFSVATSHVILQSSLTEGNLRQHLIDFRADGDYLLDGVVVTINLCNSVENKANSLNPEHSFKYKVINDDSIVDTTVVEVHWELSKTGKFKPRIEVIPISLFGTTVTYATGFNAKFINDNKIGKGAQVKITKSGEVIPFIVSVTSGTTPSLPNNQYGEWEWNDTGVDIVLKDKEIDIVIFKQVLDFFETFKVDQLKEASLRSVWEYIKPVNYNDAIIEICGLTELEWIKIIGANGSKIYSSMKKRMLNSAPETFLGACRYMGEGFGVRKAKKLLEGSSDVRIALADMTVETIVEKEGFDYKTAKNVFNGIIPTIELMESLQSSNNLVFVYNKITSEMSGVNVVMTGFRDEILKNAIESMGGKVSSGVSKKTTHLLCVDPSSSSGKMGKAKELGIKIMTPEDFKIEYL